MSLTLHKDLHSGKTKCPVCLRSFSRSYDMRIHLNKIHQVTLKLDARFNFKNMKSEIIDAGSQIDALDTAFGSVPHTLLLAKLQTLDLSVQL
uniref:C2H2-type domain-containing protein n=1 Tax=Anopheles quadriannulatus TaxID=34691 RepID=A0A182XPK6_ANOQN